MKQKQQDQPILKWNNILYPDNVLFQGKKHIEYLIYRNQTYAAELPPDAPSHGIIESDTAYLRRCLAYRKKITKWRTEHGKKTTLA